MGSKILVVEDEPALLEVLCYNFSREGYQVVTACDGADAVDKARQEKPDIIVLDLMLPKLDGLEVCRIVRRDMTVPILMLTAKVEEVDKVVGLEMGADDYVTKPFSIRELMSRVKAMLRRAAMFPPYQGESGIIRVDQIEVDTARRLASVDGVPLALKPREFDLLLFLARHRGLVFTREHLLESVWGYQYAGDSNTVDVHIHWLRNKIERDPHNPSRLVTVRGVGYKLEG
ncbi:MAG: response regulator transcription factor [Dehalococcoidia bacterium]|jgi:DNA-binding response OmpR family regulator|nr:response regulator transcription factor [Dehalococcoidia bacterium]MDP6783819.1 response regulator transcription factor [Dehalococcoidia bacterium]